MKAFMNGSVAALLFGTFLMSAGVLIFSKVHLLTGGIAGLSLILSYGVNISFGMLFFALNLPFYGLAVSRMGRRFTVKTVISVTLISVMTYILDRGLGQGMSARIELLPPVTGAILGGGLLGGGLSILYRDGSGIGGTSILAQYLQDSRQMNAGLVLLAIDVLILASGLMVVPPERIAVSILGVAVYNGLVAVLHRPGRRGQT
ncbi:YitT family protein [Hyphomonas sp. ND6WE1B]|uniref:YitT family protein n=1 Tax=Hyphomonas sp. ND6WE1B TaxID=1848191 RepID=UPI0008076C93|nr:YitT family protein [Hyphomonas sp. ND6WE1B]